MQLGIEWHRELIRKSKLFRPPVTDNFESISIDDLATNEKHWNLESNNLWHGLSKIATGQAIIDPLKITVVTPGIDVKNAKYEVVGIPGPVAAEFSMEERVIRVKDDLYSLFFLLTPGNTKTELDTLLNAFLEFKQYYNEDVPLERILPRLTKVYGDRYKGHTLKQLYQEMRNYYRGNKTFTL